MKLDYLSHRNPEWGQRDPNLAMQVHCACPRATCATKAAAYNALVERGKLVPAGWPT